MVIANQISTQQDLLENQVNRAEEKAEAHNNKQLATGRLETGRFNRLGSVALYEQVIARMYHCRGGNLGGKEDQEVMTYLFENFNLQFLLFFFQVVTFQDLCLFACKTYHLASKEGFKSFPSYSFRGLVSIVFKIEIYLCSNNTMNSGSLSHTAQRHQVGEFRIGSGMLIRSETETLSDIIITIIILSDIMKQKNNQF